MKDKQLLFLVNRFYATQKERLALGEQIGAIVRKAKEEGLTEEQIAQHTEKMSSFFSRYLALEEELGGFIEKDIKVEPMWKEFLKGVKGIGPLLGASLLVLIDIEKGEHISSLWKYAGLDVAEDGRGRTKEKEHLVPRQYKNKKGEIVDTVGITYNPTLKTVCWKIGEQFIKCRKSKYRNIYDTSKEFYKKKFPDEVKVKEKGKKTRTKYNKLHIHNMARRRMVKAFLSDFWVAWREHDGLPTSVPFAHRGEEARNKIKELIS